MTNNQPYPEEFKIEAVKQITERCHKVAEVSRGSASASTACTSGSSSTAHRLPSVRPRHRNPRSFGD